MSELEAWMQTMGPFFLGHSDLDTVEATLGPSPSGRDRLGLYPDLVHAQHLAALQACFPVLRTAMERHRAGSFAEAVHVHLRRLPEAAVHPSTLAEGFDTTLENMGSHPPWASELANLERTMSRLRSEPQPLPEARWYVHDVYVFAVGPKRLATDAPVARSRGLILGRDAQDRLRFADALPERVSVVGLIRKEMALEQLLELGMTEATLRRGREALGKAGLLDLVPRATLDALP